MRLDGYIRVSRVGGRGGDTFISPGEQRKAIEDGAKAQGHELLSWHEDLDEPGSKLDRPGLTAAMERVEGGQSEGIIVAKLDRFTRSTAHLGPLIERLRSAGGVLISVNEGIDTSTPTGKLVADIMGAISEWELTRIRDNWKAARTNAVERGIHVTGTIPLGYRKNDAGRLELAPESGAVRQLFDRRAGGESWAKLANWLTGATGGKRTYTAPGVKALIANRVYIGEARAGQGITKLAAHPPIVSKEQFAAANKARGVVPARSGRASGLLSGILRCAGCRYTMKPSLGNRSRLEYRCKAATSRAETAGGRCLAPASVSATVIEPLIVDRFFELVGDYDVISEQDEANVSAARQAELEARAELDAVLDRRLSEALGGDSSDAYLAIVQERREALDVARKALEAVEAAQGPTIPDLDFRALWPDLSMQEQRQFLASVFDCVFIRRTPNGGKTPIEDRIRICRTGEAPAIPVQGKAWTPAPFEFNDPDPPSR